MAGKAPWVARLVPEQHRDEEPWALSRLGPGSGSRRRRLFHLLELRLGLAAFTLIFKRLSKPVVVTCTLVAYRHAFSHFGELSRSTYLISPELLRRSPLLTLSLSQAPVPLWLNCKFLMDLPSPCLFSPPGSLYARGYKVVSCRQTWHAHAVFSTYSSF